ncbi:tetratricopeptide repeat protein [Streptomyces sp. HB2AG]|uniref:tetratricopeptide repeat protein n=1 Tax=Streptomyces sp. HB2AG TaxID=2983400 RepID=UPI0022AA2D28|nr:tetratricopeptide repeat protein [Streptomyces sp. HB2AG]MCZ2523328.1 tetratricopeptide repeat protein [Streptomyces sp. HB2AG]
MAPSRAPSAPNTTFRRLRGSLSPGEFAAAVRRAAREIGEQVSCDARYIGRVEAGEIRCPNYAYERVFRHMFPGRTLEDLGFAPRHSVRGRRSRPLPEGEPENCPSGHRNENDEESDVLRRAFMAGGSVAIASALALGPRPARAAGHGTGTGTGTGASDVPDVPDVPAGGGRGVGTAEVRAVEESVRGIRLLDDQYGADAIYRRAGHILRVAHGLLDEQPGSAAVADRLHAGAGELAITVGWLAHDSGRLAEARAHYAEALATARLSDDPALEAHAFCNTAFLARDAGRPREAVRAAQAARRAARQVPSARLQSLLALREAGGWAGLGDRTACEGALNRAHALFGRGTCDDDPEWMSFFGEAELYGLQAQCWAALGEHARAAGYARRAVELQDPHFGRNIALFTAELVVDLVGAGCVDEAAHQAEEALLLMGRVRSSRIRGMLDDAARGLRGHRGNPAAAAFLEHYAQARADRAGAV